MWDYGPLGVELKRNLKDRWWHAMVRARDDIEGLDAAILMHPRVWEASGHVAGFTDPLVDCRNCKRRFRADDPKIKGTPGTPDAQCPACGMKGTLSEPRQFNLMFKTFMGPVEDSAAVVYLRPETAQGIYVNFLNVQQSTRQKVPFGIAQIGKAFRNEITPGNFIFRTREFEQMEMQFFVEPRRPTWSGSSTGRRSGWSGIADSASRAERLQFHQHAEGGAGALRARRVRHPVRLRRPLGFQEIEGVHHRGDFDLDAAPGVLGQEARVLRPAEQPAVRAVRDRDVGRRRPDAARGARERLSRGGGARARRRGERVLALHPSLAPIKAGVFPLVKKDGMPEMATQHRPTSLRRHFPVFYDESGAIGRRYRRQDEVGTPFCITVDGQSTHDQHRDHPGPRHAEAGARRREPRRRRASRERLSRHDARSRSTACDATGRRSWRRSRASTISRTQASRRPRSCSRSTRVTRRSSARTRSRWCSRRFAARDDGTRSIAPRVSCSSGRPSRSRRPCAGRAGRARDRVGGRAPSFGSPTARARPVPARGDRDRRTPPIATSAC